MRRGGIYLGGIVGRYQEPDHVASILRLLRCPEVGRYSPRQNDALLCRARSRVAWEFLQSDGDVLLSVDSDIVFDAEAALLVCEQAVEHDLVGGQYITRRKGGRFCYPTTLVEDERTVHYGNDPALVPARYVAGGFVAVARRVFERLAEDPDLPLLHERVASMTFRPFYTPFWVDGNGERIYLSEDWALCERARRAGFGVWLNPAVRLLHVGPHPFRLDDLLLDEQEAQPIWLTRHADGRYVRECAQAPVQNGGIG